MPAADTSRSDGAGDRRQAGRGRRCEAPRGGEADSEQDRHAVPEAGRGDGAWLITDGSSSPAQPSVPSPPELSRWYRPHGRIAATPSSGSGKTPSGGAPNSRRSI